MKDAAGLISNKLLRLGIILLGFKLNLTVLFTQGIKCLPIAAVVVTLTIVVCYNIARKLGGRYRHLWRGSRHGIVRLHQGAAGKRG